MDQGCISCAQLPPNVESNIDDIVAHAIKNHQTAFQVLAVKDGENNTSYWGILDMKDTPEEDLYVQAHKRFGAAVHFMGLEQIKIFGVVDIMQVITRKIP